MSKTERSATLVPAVGAQVERGVGRLVTERAEAPPAAWDEWAMRRANAVYDDTMKLHMGNDSRCRAAIHVALIDAMRMVEERWEDALRLTWRAIDPLHPPGAPGSYARGQHQGMADALRTLRANSERPNV